MPQPHPGARKHGNAGHAGIAIAALLLVMLSTGLPGGHGLRGPAVAAADGGDRIIIRERRSLAVDSQQDQRDIQQAENDRRTYAADEVRRTPELRTRLWKVPHGTAVGVIAALEKQPWVESAGIDHIVHAMLTPDDPRYASEWGPAKIDAPSAWDLSTGSNSVTIAVVDTGVDYNHTDITGHITLGKNYIAGTDDPFDDNGHGTHIAGIAAGTGNDHAGMAGICWHCHILAIKVLDGFGSGYESDVAQGIIDATNAGAAIINISLGGTFDDASVDDAIQYALNRNVLVVAAAGDSGGPVAYPAASAGAMAVSATTASDALATFSNRGPQLSVAAPGANIVSTLPTGSCASCSQAGYGPLSGTSMAAAFVSGLAGLLKSERPDLSAAQLRAAIQSSADDLGPAGFDTSFGYGRINAGRAVLNNATLTAPGIVPLTSPTDGATGQTVTPTLGWGAPANEVTGATRFTVKLKTASGTVLPDVPAASAHTVTVPASAGLQNDSSYQWNVVACNGALCSSPGATWPSFSTLRTPAMQSPLPGAVIAATPITFTWQAGDSVSDYTLLVGTTAGAYDLFRQDVGTALSATVTALPIDGRTLYVSLLWQRGGTTLTNLYSYGTTPTGGCNTPARADLTSPTTATLASALINFHWGGGGCVSQYHLYVGNSYGAADLFDSGALPGTATAQAVDGLPVDGRTVFVRLWSLVNGTWQAAERTYIMGSCNTASRADITAPSGGSITTATPTFQWGGGACVMQYYFYAGSSSGAADLFNSGPLAGSVTSATVTPPIPIDGRTIYVRLWSQVNGAWQLVEHTYLMGACTGPARAEITAPTGGSITSGTPTFSWGGGACVTQYYLYMGSGYGTADLFNSSPLAGTTTSATVTPAIPVDGRTVYVRLWSLVNGGWQLAEHSYLMGACQNGARATITNPASGTLHGVSQAFAWSGGACVTQYYLYAGTSYGAADLFNSGPLAGTVSSQTLTALPANGSTVYLRLWSLVNGTWLASEQSYISAP